MWTVYYSFYQGNRQVTATCGHNHKTITASEKCKKKIDRVQKDSGFSESIIGLSGQVLSNYGQD